MSAKSLKIGTRGSPLALIQTGLVDQALQAAHPGLATERVIIRTSGDWKPEDGETRLSETQGGKGLFAREIERALMDREIDCAVHSLKDMPSFLPEGLALDHVLERADPRDAFVSYKYKSLSELPKGAKVGSSSLRRQSFILKDRSDLDVAPIRGNVQTRLDKLKDGQFDATFLALAGLQRLNVNGDFIHPVSVEDMTPACGQGIIAVETRIDDTGTRKLLDAINHKPTALCGIIERAALQVLDGSCHTPIGAYARYEGEAVLFDLVVSSGDGTRTYQDSAKGIVRSEKEAEEFGRALALKLKPLVPPDIFS